MIIMNIFPKKILAIDISDGSIEILQMSYFLGKSKVTFLSRLKLEKGIVEKGRILKRKELILKLREYCNGIKNAKVAVALPDTIVFNYIFKFPVGKSVSADEVASEAKRVLPIDLGESYFDFVSQDTGEGKEVFFAAALKKDIDEYKSVFKELNFVPEIFDLNSLCALRVIDPDSDDGALVFDLGGRFGALSIFSKRLLQLTDIVNLGGDDFTDKLSERLNVPYERAEFLKNTAGFDSDKEEGRIFLILQEVLQPLINEIRKIINFYEAKNKIKIQSIILSGEAVLIPKLDEYIFENFGIRAKIGEPHFKELVLNYLESNNIRSGIDQIFFAATLGLATKYLGVKTNFNMGINLLK